MVRLEMVLEMMVYLPFNHLMQLIPQESSVELVVMKGVDSILVVYDSFCVVLSVGLRFFEL